MVKGYESASEGIRALLHQDRKLQEVIKSVESQILSIESQYLEDTHHGNISRGWDGYIDSKPGKKEIPIRKVRPASDSELKTLSAYLNQQIKFYQNENELAKSWIGEIEIDTATEAELAAVDDAMSVTLWSRRFLTRAGRPGGR